MTCIWHTYIHFVCVGNESAVQFRACQGEHARIDVLWMAVYVLNRSEYILIVRYIVSSYKYMFINNEVGFYVYSAI